MASELSSIAIPWRLIIGVHLMLKVEQLLCLHSYLLIIKFACFVFHFKLSKRKEILCDHLDSVVDSLTIGLLLWRARSKSFEQQPCVVLLDQFLPRLLEDFDQSFSRLDHDWCTIDKEVDHRYSNDHLCHVMQLLLVCNKLPCEEAQEAKRVERNNFVDAFCPLVLVRSVGPEADD